MTAHRSARTPSSGGPPFFLVNLQRAVAKNPDCNPSSSSPLPSRLQKYDAELFKMAKSCLCAIAGALPPDFVDVSLEGMLEKQASVDSQGNFDPKPINTAKSVPSECHLGHVRRALTGLNWKNECTRFDEYLLMNI